MKYWKCNLCYTEKETDDKVIICICPACLESMIGVKKDGRQFK